MMTLTASAMAVFLLETRKHSVEYDVSLFHLRMPYFPVTPYVPLHTFQNISAAMLCAVTACRAAIKILVHQHLKVIYHVSIIIITI